MKLAMTDNQIWGQLRLGARDVDAAPSPSKTSQVVILPHRFRFLPPVCCVEFIAEIDGSPTGVIQAARFP
jgi:hypothetical protein